MSKKKREVWTKNRDVAKRARQGKHWCIFCDMYLVGPGERCLVCGKKEIKNLKKETNA